MNIENTGIKFLPNNKERKIIFNHIYNRLSKIKSLREYSNLQSTDITGIYEESQFLVYKDPENINKICIIMINDEDEIIICIDSNNIDNYFDECKYYSKYKTQNNFYIETTGLGIQTRKYCKFDWNNKTRNYTICLKEENKKYKYIMKLKDTTGESQVICTWDNFDQFIKNEKPEQIEVCDEMRCIRSNFTITNHNSYNSENSNETYESIEKIIKCLGLSLNYESPKRYIRSGMSLDSGIREIIKRYIKQEKQAQKQYLQELEENKNNKLLDIQSNSRRHSIELTEHDNISKEEDYSLTGYETARRAIEQHEKRKPYITVQETGKKL